LFAKNKTDAQSLIEEVPPIMTMHRSATWNAELELEATKKDVGLFRADFLCRTTIRSAGC
jgi:hypothetical protein